MATSSSKKKTGTAKKSAPAAKKPAAAPKKQPAAKAAPASAPTAPTWPYALACIVLSLLAFLGLFHAEGVVIDGFAGFLCGIMGWGFWAFPFAMLLLAWTFVRNPERHFCLRVTASLLIAPLFGTIVHLMVCRVAFTAQTFGAIVGQLYDGGKALTSGGVISGGIGYLLKAGISVYAALPLTKSEYAICEYLATHAGQVFSKEQIYEAVFGYDGCADDSAVTEHVKNIRAKLKAAGGAPIETVWGIGYKWKNEEM